MFNHHSRILVSGMALVVAAVASLGAQDEGVKQIQELIKRARAQVESITDAKQQLQKTMQAYNGVLAPDVKDRQDAYKKLQKEISTTEKKRAEVTSRRDQLNVEADKLFKSWEVSTASIQSSDLRTRSEERQKRTQGRFADIRQIGQQAADLYTPFMKTLQDQVTFLGHDLNPGAVSSLKQDAEKLNAQASELYAAIDKVTAAANDNITKLSSE